MYIVYTVHMDNLLHVRMYSVIMFEQLHTCMHSFIYECTASNTHV